MHDSQVAELLQLLVWMSRMRIWPVSRKRKLVDEDVLEAGESGLASDKLSDRQIAYAIPFDRDAAAERIVYPSVHDDIIFALSAPIRFEIGAHRMAEAFRGNLKQRAECHVLRIESSRANFRGDCINQAEVLARFLVWSAEHAYTVEQRIAARMRNDADAATADDNNRTSAAAHDERFVLADERPV